MFHDIIVQQDQAGHTIHALRDVTREQFARYGSQLPDLLRRRAGYVIAEDARVLSAAKLLEEGLIEQVGPLLWQSHAGLRDEYEVSSVELDTLVEIAWQVPGVLGARMMGGGFGGCTINLVHNEAIEALRSEEHTSELQSPDHLVCRLLLEKKKNIHNDALMLSVHQLHTLN